jgi:hypothetical protein
MHLQILYLINRPWQGQSGEKWPWGRCLHRACLCGVVILLFFAERTMLHKNVVPDKSLLQTINQRLDRTGTSSQTRLSASVQRGTVTLSGTLQYESQRAPIVRAVTSIAGVHQVIDRLRSGEVCKY